MKDDYLTLRIPAALARALARQARDKSTPKSQIVREAVTRYLEPGASAPTRVVTGAELATLWPLLPRLTPAEAKAMERDVVASRKALPRPLNPWA